MALGGGDEGGDDSDQVVVHVTWVAESGSGSGHNC